VAHQLEVFLADQVRDVALRAGEEVVDADEVAARRQQAVAQMRAEKSGTAGNQDASFEMHEDWMSRREPLRKRREAAVRNAARYTMRAQSATPAGTKRSS